MTTSELLEGPALDHLLLWPSGCRNQEAAFWLLAALVEDILPPDNYNSNLVGCQVSDAGQFEGPAVAMHMPACTAGAFLLHALSGIDG